MVTLCLIFQWVVQLVEVIMAAIPTVWYTCWQGGGFECFKCGRPGHYARDCMDGETGGARGDYGGRRWASDCEVVQVKVRIVMFVCIVEALSMASAVTDHDGTGGALLQSVTLWWWRCVEPWSKRSCLFVCCSSRPWLTLTPLISIYDSEPQCPVLPPLFADCVGLTSEPYLCFCLMSSRKQNAGHFLVSYWRLEKCFRTMPNCWSSSSLWYICLPLSWQQQTPFHPWVMVGESGGDVHFVWWSA